MSATHLTSPLFLLVAAVLLICASCGEDTTGPSLDSSPPAPGGFAVINGDSSVTIRWNFMDEVSPSLSFSGYKVYMRNTENDDTRFLPSSTLDIKPNENTNLPLIKRSNSLASGHMEVKVIKLKPGTLYQFYVVGVQNGLSGPPSRTEDATPFRLVKRIIIREESEIRSWFYMHDLFARYSAIDVSLVGYDFDSDELTHHLIWMPISEGGALRVQRSAPRREDEMAPGEGYISEPDQGRLKLVNGDAFWVWDTNGTPNLLNDDHYGRIEVTRIVSNSSARQIEVDCAYQIRAGARNF